MSAELRSLVFAVTVADVDRWSYEHRAAAGASDSEFYSDWAVGQLHRRMYAAGQAFIDENPDLFLTDLT